MSRMNWKQRRGNGGAVLAEFVVAVVPLFMAFFTFWQVAIMASAKMIVRHATIVGARASAVITGGGETNPGKEGEEQGSEEDVKSAVKDALGIWGDNGMLTANVDVQDSGGAQGMVTVNVDATFKCNTPLGRSIVCGGGGTMAMQDTASMPKQGATYK